MVSLALTVNQHGRAGLDGHLLPPVHLVPILFSLLDARDRLELGPSVRRAHEARVHLRLLVGSGEEGLMSAGMEGGVLTYETAVLWRAVFQRNPAPYRARRVGVEERRVVVTGDWGQLDRAYYRSGSATVQRHSPTPPIRGCLQMIMVWSTRGSLMFRPRLLATSFTLSLVVTSRKTGSARRPWPILLIEREGGYRSFGGSPSFASDRAEGSRK